MSLSDCAKCWETPCSCGWDYIDWENDRLDKQVQLLTKIRELKVKNPDAPKLELWRKLNEEMYKLKVGDAK